MPTEDGGMELKSQELSKGDRGYLKMLLSFMRYKDMFTYDDVENFDRREFDEYRTIIFDPSSEHQNQSTLTRSLPRSNHHSSEAELFRKSIKKDRTTYPTFKEDRQWDKWNRSVKAVARTHGCGIILDPSYIPESEEEIELFKEAVYETGIKEKNGIVKADACDVNEQRFKERIRYALGAKWKDWEIHARHKMDSEEIIVGAASILAKVRRDKEIEKISDLLNLDVGSGYPSDPKTKEAVKKLVNSKTPNQYLRWSWATVKNAWNSTHDLPIPIREELGRTRIQSSLNEWSNTEM